MARALARRVRWRADSKSRRITDGQRATPRTNGLRHSCSAARTPGHQAAAILTPKTISTKSVFLSEKKKRSRCCRHRV